MRGAQQEAGSAGGEGEHRTALHSATESKSLGKVLFRLLKCYQRTPFIDALLFTAVTRVGFIVLFEVLSISASVYRKRRYSSKGDASCLN